MAAAKARVSRSEVIWMSVAAMLMPAAILIGALVFVAFYTAGYTLFQQIAMLVVALIAVVAAEATLWMVWAAKRGMMRWPQQR